MKKSVVIILLFILLVSLIYAQDEINPTDELKKNTEVSANDINNKMDVALHKEIAIPSAIQSITKLLFGIQQEKITFETLIIILAILFMLLIVIYSIVSLIPIFQKFISFLISIIITCLISITGFINKALLFSLSIGKDISLLTKFSFLRILLILLFSLIIIVIALSVSNLLRKKAEKEINKVEGMKLGVEIGKSEIRNKADLG